MKPTRWLLSSTMFSPTVLVAVVVVMLSMSTSVQLHNADDHANRTYSDHISESKNVYSEVVIANTSTESPATTAETFTDKTDVVDFSSTHTVPIEANYLYLANARRQVADEEPVAEERMGHDDDGEKESATNSAGTDKAGNSSPSGTEYYFSKPRIFSTSFYEPSDSSEIYRYPANRKNLIETLPKSTVTKLSGWARPETTPTSPTEAHPTNDSVDYVEYNSQSSSPPQQQQQQQQSSSGAEEIEPVVAYDHKADSQSEQQPQQPFEAYDYEINRLPATFNAEAVDNNNNHNNNNYDNYGKSDDNNKNVRYVPLGSSLSSSTDEIDNSAPGSSAASDEEEEASIQGKGGELLSTQLRTNIHQLIEEQQAHLEELRRQFRQHHRQNEEDLLLEDATTRPLYKSRAKGKKSKKLQVVYIKVSSC